MLVNTNQKTNNYHKKKSLLIHPKSTRKNHTHNSHKKNPTKFGRLQSHAKMKKQGPKKKRTDTQKNRE